MRVPCGVCSTERDFLIGIPQGSCLRPYLFLIYVNDFPRCSSFLSSVLFADDTTVSFSHHDYNSLISIMNAEILNIKNWTESNRLTINISKTNAMIYSNRNIPDYRNYPIVFDGNEINFTSNQKFLGVFIDNRLNFAKHVNYISKKISRNTGILYRIKRFLPRTARIQFYYSFIYHYLSYSILVWGATYETHLRNLVVQQKE